MSSTAAPERVLIAGEAGDIETLIEHPASTPRAVALCCHPHPLFGGTLTNKVIHTVARAFLAEGAITLRFNFRGVGASKGVHDGGEGETRDVLRLATWARSRWPELPLWLGGFSFGAWVSLRVQSELLPALLVSVAPPVGRWDFSSVSPPQCPWLVIQGDRDELVDVETVSRWVEKMGSQMPRPVQFVRLAGAEHFFHGRLHEVKDAVVHFVAQSAV